MPRTITAANAILMISVTNLFSTPQKIQGFAADDVFDTEDLDTAEVAMGVDGNLSVGLVYNPVIQNFMLMADSLSNDFFEAIFSAERAAGDKYFLQGTITLPGIARSWTMTKGVLSGYNSVPNVKKVVQPRKFKITWERVSPAPS